MLHRQALLIGYSTLAVLLAACGGPAALPDIGGGGGAGGGGGGGGGDGGGGTPVSPFTAPTEQQALYFRNDLPDDMDAVQGAYNQGGRTPFGDLPTGAAVSYAGFMEVLFTSTPNANISSAATLSVDMQTGATTGSATAFMGYVYNSETDSTELALYEGGITFLGATLTSNSGNANIDIEIDGAFDNGVQQFTIAGNIDGPIYGPNADGLYASGNYFGLGQEITLTADGVPVYGSATLWALSE